MFLLAISKQLVMIRHIKN